MFQYLDKTSLRTRLIVITAFAIIALLVAVVSAWRVAQMSETFARRQAESSVSNAVREMLRETRDFPEGRTNLNANDRLLPHERDILKRDDDPFVRSSSIALHRFPETAGVFCASDGETLGLTVSNDFGDFLTNQEMAVIENVCRQIALMRDFNTQQIAVGNKILLVSAAPASIEANINKSSTPKISGAVAFRRWSPSGGFSDWFSLLTQGLLLIFVVGLAGFSFLTWRDWQRGMTLIEKGMRQIPDDLSQRVVAPPMPELEKISDSINDLAADLETNLSRQKELEQSLIRNEKLAALGRVVAGVAHEVRNPLASMKLKIQLAERNKSDADKLEKTFNVLREEIDRLDNLVKKLLEVSRPAKLNLSKISVAELLGQRTLLFAEKSAAQNVRINFHKPNEKAEIFADRERLTQVFDNLFNNSLEAMPNGGKLEISLEKKAKNYRIKFADDGKGFNEVEREQLFEPFFTTKDNGTGLGLTISREIVEAHDGSLSLENTETGAVFVVELPSRFED